MTEDSPAKSETRRRSLQVPVRFDAAELARLDDRCEQTGLSRAAFLRKCATGRAGPRSRRKPSLDRQAIEQLTGALHQVAASNNKIGNNLNQIARKLNMTGLPDMPDDLEARLEIVQGIVTAAVEHVEAGRPDVQATYQLLREALGYDN